MQVITNILDRSKGEAQAYLACRNILTELGGKNATQEEAGQEMLDINDYLSSLKRVMAALTTAKDQPAAAAAAAQNVKNLKEIQNLSRALVREAEHSGLERSSTFCRRAENKTVNSALYRST